MSHDTLAVSWNEIRRVRPDARDAFSSPEQDIVAVVYGENIGFYLLEPDTSGDPKIISKPVLELELDSHESIVMVQWAVGNYVEEWKKKTKKWLE